MVFFIRDVFEHPNESNNRKYTDSKYQLENQGGNPNQAHIINRLNAEIGNSIVRNKKSQRILKNIVNKITQTISSNGQVKNITRYMDKSDLI